MTQKIYQKQFSISEILSESWKRFIENFRLILIITLIGYVPVNILLELFVSIDDPINNIGLYLAIFVLIQTFGYIISLVVTMAIAYAIKNKIDGKIISVSQAFKKSFSRCGAAIGASVIVSVFLIGLTLLLIIPGIIYSVYWMFIVFVVALNDKSGKDALDYSKEIVKGRWWTVTGYSIVFLVPIFIIMMIGQVPFLFLSENLFVNVVANTFVDILVVFYIVILTILFINFEATKKIETVE